MSTFNNYRTFSNENARVARCFLAALMRPYGPTNTLRLEIRPLWPDWREAEFYPDGNAPWNWASQTPRGVQQWFPPTECALDEAARHAVALASQYEVYYGVLLRAWNTKKRRWGGGQDDVRVTSWLWCDVDGGDGGVDGAIALLKEAIKNGLPKPHIVVVSGNGIHAYWRLSELVDLPDKERRRWYNELLKRLCRAIGGTSLLLSGICPICGAEGKSKAAYCTNHPHADSARADVASILRIPGTYNHKRPNEPRAVRLLRFAPDAEAHSLTWWRAFLPVIPLPATQKRIWQPPTDVDIRFGERMLTWANDGYPEGERHKHLISDAAWLMHDKGFDRETARELLRMKVAASPGSHPITDEELEGILQWP